MLGIAHTIDFMPNSEIIGKPKFTRTKEDFRCFHCHKGVKGTGYTDHCPYCLWSLHVDINPGDRSSSCRGEMAPISAVNERKNIKIRYECLKCGIIKNVNAAPNDSKDLLLKLIDHPTKQYNNRFSHTTDKKNR